MNHIETGIDEATDTAEAAIPKSTATTAGDILYATGSSAITRLGIGTAHYMLATNSGQTAPIWVPSPKSVLTATGDILYASAANTLQRLPIGSAGQILTVSGGIPAWAASTGTVITKYQKTTEKDVNSTVTKTDLLNGEITIGANVMSSSGALYLECGGDFLNSTGSSRTIDMELKLGSTVLWDSNTSSFASNANRRAWHFRCVLQALGATNSQRGSGTMTVGGVTTTATTGTGALEQVSGSTAQIGPFLTAASAVDMTSSQALTFSVTLSTSSASLSMRLEYASVSVY